MEMLIADNNLDEEYEEWFMKKEAYDKLTKQIWNEYLRVFGRLLIQHFQWESACKCMKKKIFYKTKYSRDEADKIIRKEMEEDFKSWNHLNKETENANFSFSITPVQLKEIDVSYYSIFKTLRPDYYLEEENQLLWKQSQEAYICNDEETLKRIKELLKNQKQVDNPYNDKELIRRTKSLKKEIREIKKSEIFEYKRILEDPQLILKKEKQLIEEINGNKYYFQHLKRKLKQLIW